MPTLRYFLLGILSSGLSLLGGGVHAQGWAAAAAPEVVQAQLGTLLTAVDSAGNELIAGSFTGTLEFDSTTLVSTAPADLFVAKRTAAGRWLWAVRAGGAGRVVPTVLRLGAGGEVWVTGEARESATIRFGTGSVPVAAIASSGGAYYGGFVALVSATGHWQWALPTPNPPALAVDRGGDAYVSGAYYAPRIVFGPDTIVSGMPALGGAYVARLTRLGRWAWGRGTVVGHVWLATRAVAIDPAGNVCLTGSFSSALVGDSARLGPSWLRVTVGASAGQGFLAKMSASGAWQWARPLTRQVSRGFDLAIDPRSGSITLVGSAGGVLQFAGLTDTLRGPFVARLDSTGTAGEWLRTSDLRGLYAWWTRLALTPAGDLILTGRLGGVAVLGSDTLCGTTSWYYPFVARLAAATGTWQWARLIAGPDRAHPLELTAPAVDPTTGQVRLAGVFRQEASFGPTRLCTARYPRGALARLSATGDWLGAESIGTDGGESGAVALARDAAGNHYLGGWLRGNVRFGATVLYSDSAATNLFVAKRSAAGVWAWAVRAGGSGLDSLAGLTLDSAGRVWLTGSFRDTAVFGPTTLISAGSRDAFVARLSAAGQWEWAARVGGPANDAGVALAALGDSAVVVAGTFRDSTLTLGTTVLPNPGIQATFLARLTASGQWRWALGAAGCGGREHATATAVALDSAGNAYLVGSFNTGSRVNFGAIGLVRPANADTGGGYSFVARAAAVGAWEWAATSRPDSALAPGWEAWQGWSGARAVRADRRGGVFVAGCFIAPSIRFGATRLRNASDYGLIPTVNNPDAAQDVYVARLTAITGAWEWAVRAGAGGAPLSVGSCGEDTMLEASYDVPTDLALTPTGGVRVAGYSLRATDTTRARFGPHVLTTDGFVATLSATGQWTDLQAANLGWQQHNVAINGFSEYGYPDLPARMALVVAPEGATYLAGTYYGAAVFDSVRLPRPGLGRMAFVAALDAPPPPLGLVASSATGAAPLLVWPNPARGAAQVALPAGNVASVVLLLDALGRPVRRVPLTAGQRTAPISLVGLTPGLYLIRAGGDSRRLIVE